MKKQDQNQASGPVYELGYLLADQLTDEKVAKKVTDLKGIVSQDAEAVIDEGEPELRTLAYTITTRRDGKRKDYSKAHFGWIKFESSADKINNIEETVKADNEVIRFLLIKTVREDTLAHLEVEEMEEGEEDEINSEDAENTKN